MERRRLQLANSHSGGGDSLFPITLVQGDNGQKGIDLYEYYMSQVPEYNSITVLIEDGQIIVNGEVALKLGISNGPGVGYDNFQIYTESHNSPIYHYQLKPDGNLIEYED